MDSPEQAAPKFGDPCWTVYDGELREHRFARFGTTHRGRAERRAVVYVVGEVEGRDPALIAEGVYFSKVLASEVAVHQCEQGIRNAMVARREAGTEMLRYGKMLETAMRDAFPAKEQP